MFAILGNIEFEVLGGITGIEQRGAADWAEHARIQGKPLLQWVGDGLDELTLHMGLHAWLGDPDARLRALRQAKAAHEPLAFVLGSGDYLGVFVITEINSSSRRASALGQTFAATLQVTLREYTGAFTRKPLRPGLLNAATPGAPGVVSQFEPQPTPAQQALRDARAATSVLRASRDLHDAIRGGDATLVAGQVPRLLSVSARAVEPLLGFATTAEQLDNGAVLAEAGHEALDGVLQARQALSNANDDNVIDQVDSAGSHVERAAGAMDGVSPELAQLAAQVATRRA